MKCRPVEADAVETLFARLMDGIETSAGILFLTAVCTQHIIIFISMHLQDRNLKSESVLISELKGKTINQSMFLGVKCCIKLKCAVCKRNNS